MTYRVKMMRPLSAGLLVGVLAVACGDDPTDPTDVTFGETTIVVVVNPPLNTDNGASLPAPGSVRSGVSVSVVGGPSALSDANGVAVLADVTAGTRTIALSSGAMNDSVSVTIGEGDLHEVAVALNSSGATIMRNIEYDLSGEVVEVLPTTPLADVNELLGQSNIIVFFRGGTYTGDLAFSGSGVTVFGEGAGGGAVTLNGDVLVDGSANRLRGIRVTGTLTVPGSSAGISFSRVAGALDVAGSSATLLNNAFCSDTIDVTGSNPALLGNQGLDPLPEPATGC